MAEIPEKELESTVPTVRTTTLVTSTTTTVTAFPHTKKLRKESIIVTTTAVTTTMSTTTITTTTANTKPTSVTVPAATGYHTLPSVPVKIDNCKLFTVCFITILISFMDKT